MYRVPRMGRKLVMMVSSALMGISIFLFSAVNDQASNIGLNAMEYFFQSTSTSHASVTRILLTHAPRHV